MSTSKSALVLICMSFLSCKLDPADPNVRRTTLGDVKIMLASTRGNPADVELRGRVTDYDKVDSVYNTHKHFIEVRDTISGRKDTVYYTLPLSPYLKVDTTLRIVMFYKRIENRFALLIKDKRDSLLCLFGTLLLPDLEQLEIKGGVQGIRIIPGTEARATRNTTCGREGDFNTIFSDKFNSTNVQPAQTSVLFSGEKSYLVANIADTYLIKNLQGCRDSVGQFAYAIIRQ
ncbi:MAG: hypothetical protein ABI623_00475 [bacterium]